MTPSAHRMPPAAGDASLEALRAELAERIAALVPGDGMHETAYPGLIVARFSAPSALDCGQYWPSLTIAAQGAKQVHLGDDVYEYDASHYLVSAFDLPVQARITQATPQSPYLCLALDLDALRISELVSEADLPTAPEAGPVRGIAVGSVNTKVLEPALRLVRLLDEPRDLRVLGPLVEREMLYRLLTGELGPRLRRIVLPGGPAQQIARAIEWIKRHFASPLRIENLAQAVNMSPSSLHHHFKAVTAMSPLQYQKQVRLREARRLMLAEHLDAGAAAHRVGYESASQFSREYSRLFGLPPVRDIARLRGSPLVEA
ncbi:AraC family transcriptional regulator [uncultured Pigmentiphaga sp.]|uniref:AraC family transcriptional regulator n=1 Tax=uncultured Pigmentiphaga sp. TaxID=340361 RepID=UPI00262AF010|nr:AraC family transcriptional regulator [uncultured Pigmentiphaga sp.]